MALTAVANVAREEGQLPFSDRASSWMGRKVVKIDPSYNRKLDFPAGEKLDHSFCDELGRSFLVGAVVCLAMALFLSLVSAPIVALVGIATGDIRGPLVHAGRHILLWPLLAVGLSVSGLVLRGVACCGAP